MLNTGSKARRKFVTKKISSYPGDRRDYLGTLLPIVSLPSLALYIWYVSDGYTAAIWSVMIGGAIVFSVLLMKVTEFMLNKWDRGN